MKQLLRIHQSSGMHWVGNGFVHEEFHSQDFTRKGGTFQMVQLWVNLRAKDKCAKAGYQTLLKTQIPNVELPQEAGTVRVIAGDYNGRKGAAQTCSPINRWDVNLRAGKSGKLPTCRRGDSRPTD